MLHVLESTGASCMLRKWHLQSGCDEVIRNYRAWRMLSCKRHCVLYDNLFINTGMLLGCAEAYREWCILNLELYFPCTGLGKLVTLNVIQWCSEVPVTFARPYVGCSVDSYCILYSGCFCGVLIFVISPGVMKFSTHKLSTFCCCLGRAVFHCLLLVDSA